MKDAAANFKKYAGVPRDESRDSDELFYAAAGKHFENRLVVCDVIPGMGSEKSKKRKRGVPDETQAQETAKDFVPEEVYFAGRK
jgi:hypothetical protein